MLRELFDNPLRGISRERKARVRRALRDPQALTDPADAELVVRTARVQRRFFDQPQSRWGRVLRLVIAAAVVVHGARFAADFGSAFAPAVAVVLIAVVIGAEVWRHLKGPELAARLAEAERLNANFLASVGTPVEPEPDRTRWHENVAAYASLAAPAVSTFAFAVGAAIEDEDGSHARLLAATAVAVLAGAGTCAVGAAVGVAARRRGRGGAGSTRVAAAGIILNVVAIVGWIAVGILVLVTEW